MNIQEQIETIGFCILLSRGVVQDSEQAEYIAKRLVELGFGNIEQALTAFVEKVEREIIKGDGDEEESEFTRGYNCACDSHTEVIDKTLHEFLNSLKNQNQGDN